MLFVIGPIELKEVEYLKILSLRWIMEVKYWLGYLAGQAELEYFSSDQLMYYWANGGKVFIESNHRKQISGKIHALGTFRTLTNLGYRSPFEFHYPQKVSLNAYYVVDDLIKECFHGITCDGTFAICEIGEAEFCSSKHNYLSICQIIENKFVCESCSKLLQQKVSRIYPGYVYLIGNSNNKIYKIGKSRQPKERYKAVATKLPFPVKIIHVIGGDDIEKAEKLLHNTFAKKRTHGEWFELSDDDVNQILNLVSFDGKVFWDTNENIVVLK
jgi:hypothetical protein